MSHAQRVADFARRAAFREIQGFLRSCNAYPELLEALDRYLAVYPNCDSLQKSLNS